MKTLFILFCSILLAPMVALSQSGPASIMIYARTQPASAGGETKLLADWFESQVVKLLQDKYPCAQPMTASAVRDVLDLNRQRALLGADTEEDMKSLAGSLGAKYLISLTVTELGSGQVALNAFMMDLANAKTQARAGNVTGGGEAAFDAVEAFAKQFVDSLSSLPQFSKSKCNPTNPWTGTITYRLVQNHEDNSERKAISGDGTVTTTTKRSLNHDVTIRIGWTGRPQAFVTANESDTSEEIGKVRVDCRRPTIAYHGPEWKSAGWDHVTRMEQTAGDNVDARVSVTLANGRYRIDLDVPEIQGTTKVKVRKHNDGGCGKPNDNSPAPVQLPWHFKKPLPVIDMPLRKPDALQGSDNDASGGIITWNLTRTPMRK